MFDYELPRILSSLSLSNGLDIGFITNCPFDLSRIREKPQSTPASTRNIRRKQRLNLYSLFNRILLKYPRVLAPIEHKALLL